MCESWTKRWPLSRHSSAPIRCVHMRAYTRRADIDRLLNLSNTLSVAIYIGIGAEQQQKPEGEWRWNAKRKEEKKCTSFPLLLLASWYGSCSVSWPFCYYRMAIIAMFCYLSQFNVPIPNVNVSITPTHYYWLTHLDVHLFQLYTVQVIRW